MIPRHSFDPASQPHTKRFVVVSHVHIVAYQHEPINKPNSERMTSSDSCACVEPPQRTTSTQANLIMMHRPRNVMCWQIRAISESLQRVAISSRANRSVHPTMPSPTRHTYVSDRLCSFARPGGLNVFSQHVRIVCDWDRRTGSLCRFARFNALNGFKSEAVPTLPTSRFRQVS